MEKQYMPGVTIVILKTSVTDQFLLSFKIKHALLDMTLCMGRLALMMSAKNKITPDPASGGVC